MQCVDCGKLRHDGPCPDNTCQGCGYELEYPTEDRLCDACREEIGDLLTGPSWPELAEEIFNERTN